MVKIFISNCYVINHILHSKCTPLADTVVSSRLEKSFIPLTTDFCRCNFCEDVNLHLYFSVYVRNPTILLKI